MASGEAPVTESDGKNLNRQKLMPDKEVTT